MESSVKLPQFRVLPLPPKIKKKRGFTPGYKVVHSATKQYHNYDPRRTQLEVELRRLTNPYTSEIVYGGVKELRYRAHNRTLKRMHNDPRSVPLRADLIRSTARLSLLSQGCLKSHKGPERYHLKEMYGTTKKYIMHKKSKAEVRWEEREHMRHVARAFQQAWNKGRSRLDMTIKYECMSREEKIARLKELLRPLVGPWKEKRAARLAAEQAAIEKEMREAREWQEAYELEQRNRKRDRIKEEARLQKEFEERQKRTEQKKRALELAEINAQRAAVKAENAAIKAAEEAAKKAEDDAIERERIRVQNLKLKKMIEEQEREREMERAEQAAAELEQKLTAELEAADKAKKEKQRKQSLLDASASRQRLKSELEPLISAIHGHHTQEVINLIKRQPFNEREGFVNTLDTRGKSPLHHAVQHAKGVDIPSVLLKYRADPNERTNKGKVALHFACREDDRMVIQLLIKHGASMNIPDNDGQLPWQCGATESENIALKKFMDDALHASNNPPRLKRKIADCEAYMTENFNLVLPADTFVDKDGDDLTYDVAGLPDTFNFDPRTLTISGKPSDYDVARSPFTVYVTASDEFASAETSFSLTAKFSRSRAPSRVMSRRPSQEDLSTSNKMPGPSVPTVAEEGMEAPGSAKN